MAPAGPCSPGAMEMGTRGIATCPRRRQDHRQLSRGGPVQSLAVDQATHVSHRPDMPLMAHCWWRGLLPSAQAHPAGAALQSQASPQGAFGLLHARKAPRDSVTPGCPLSPFPISHFSSPKVLHKPAAHHTCTRASPRRSRVWLGLAPARAAAEAAAPWPASSWRGAAPRVSINTDASLKPACKHSQAALLPGLVGMPMTMWLTNSGSPIAFHSVSCCSI